MGSLAPFCRLENSVRKLETMAAPFSRATDGRERLRRQRSAPRMLPMPSSRVTIVLRPGVALRKGTA